MKNVPNVIVYIVAGLIIALAVAEVHDNTTLLKGANMVNWQIHSWDDLREWNAMLAKGAQWIKVDMHFKNQEFCAAIGAGNADGCFVLLHDTPTLGVKYNTSDDLLSYITQHPLYFKNPSQTMYIALCFKEAPLDLCGASGVRFSTLMNSFKQRVDLLTSQGYNLQFVLDGDLDMMQNCAKKFLEPWPSTWQGLPINALWSESSPFERLLVFDLPDVNLLIQEMANLDWGKFLKGKWPLLVWEPSNEKDIDRLVNIYLDWAKRYTSNYPLPDFRFAINIDPIQFQLYSAAATQTTWRQIISPSSAYRRPLVTAIWKTSNFIPKFNVMFYVFSLNDNGKTFYSCWGAYDSQAPPTMIQGFQQWPQQQPILSVSSTVSKFEQDEGWLILTTDTNNWNVFTSSMLGAVQPSFTSKRNTVPTYMVGTWVSNLPDSPLQSNATALILKQSDPESACSGWTLTSYSYSTLSSSAYATNMACIDVPIKYGISVSASIVAAWKPKSSISTETAFEGVLTISSGDVIFAATFESNPKNLKFFVSRVSPIDVGGNTTLSLAFSENGIPVVQEIHGAGYCWNTEKRNKQPFPLVCDQTAVSTPGVLNYNYGSLDSWRRHLSANPVTSISSCHENIVHGTFDQGHSPYHTLVSPMGKVFSIEVHEGWTATDSDISQCGAPISRDANGGLLLNSWVPHNANL